MSAVHTLKLSPGRDLAFEVYVPPAREPTSGALLPYPDTQITGWIAEGAAPGVALNGAIKTFTHYAARKWIWLFDSAEVDACLAQVSPAPFDGATFYALAKAAGNFIVYCQPSYWTLRAVPSHVVWRRSRPSATRRCQRAVLG